MKYHPKVFFSIIIAALLLIPCLAQTTELSDKDKALIIESVVKTIPEIKARISQDFPTDNISINISSKNIDVKLLPKIPNIDFVILDTKSIKLPQSGSLIFWKFVAFEVKDSKVLVCLSKVGMYRGFVPLENALTYEYQKINDKWVGKIVGGYVT